MKTRRLTLILTGALVIGSCAILCLVVRLRGSDAPVQAVFSDWQATMEIAEDRTAVRVQMSGEIFRAEPDSPALVPLFPLNTVFKNLLVNGVPSTPVRNDGWFSAELEKPGEYLISALLDIKPENDRGDYRLSLIKPETVRSIVRVDSQLPLEVYIPGVTGEIRGATNSGTHGMLIAGLGKKMTVVWHEPRPPVTREGTASVKPSAAWTIGERILSANMLLDVSVVGGQTDKMTIVLPQGADNVKLKGGNVRESHRSGSMLNVFFISKVSTKTELRLSFDVPRLSGSIIRFPDILIEDGRIDSGGWVLVLSDCKGVLLENDVTGMKAASDLDIPGNVMGLAAGKPIYMYERSARELKSEFDLVSTTPFQLVDTIADRANMLCVVRPGGEEIIRISYSIRNNGKQFLRMKMPEGSEMLSAEVENKPCKISNDGKYILIPLARSVQTLGGLVPFPVEIVYCRQGDPASDMKTRRMDLPELDGVPVALVKVTVLCPKGTTLRGYESKLAKVDNFSMKEDLGLWTLARKEDSTVQEGQRLVVVTNAVSESLVQNSLGFNYYNAGYEAYQNNRLEEAEVYLTNAVAFAPDTDLAKNANDLLGNIWAGRGEVSGKADRLERAKISKIQKGLSAENPTLMKEQEELIKAGLANIDEGDEELGAELLEEASRLGVQLQQRADSSHRQKSIDRVYKKKLNEANKSRATNLKLKSQLEKLQVEVLSISKKGDKRQGQVLAQELAVAAKDERLDVAEVQNTAFGNDDGNWGYKQKGQITKRGKAKQFQKGYQGKRKPKVSKSSKARRGRSGSLSWQNEILSSKVNALKRAVKAANNTMGYMSDIRSQSQQRAQRAEAVNAARRQTVLAERNLKTVMESFKEKNSKGYTMEDIVTEQKIEKINTWAMANGNTYGALDPSLERQISGLRSQIDEAKREVAETREKRMLSTNIFLDIDDVVNAETTSDQVALEQFLYSNYLPQEEGKEGQFKIEQGRISVVNASSNVSIINNAVDNFRRNDGQVVSVAGRQISANPADMPVMQKYFDSKTGDNRNYAVLDEGQYRSLVQVSEMDSANRKPSAQPVFKGQAKREVIVGTPNRVAGEEFQLDSSDSDYNAISVGGKEIKVPHNKYLVIDNGSFVSVLKAGEMRDWQEKDEDMIDLEPSLPSRIELPEMGVAFRFEKVLLAEGESADIEMKL